MGIAGEHFYQNNPIMLVKELLVQQYKSFIRNEKWRRNLPGKIIAGLMIIMAIAAFFLLGIFIEEILKSAGGDPVQTFNAYLLWFFAGDWLMRCFLQPLPTLELVPLLRLPVHRRKLIRFLLFTSLLHFFNCFPFLVLVPFSIKVLFPVNGAVAVVSYLSGTFLIVILNNYLAVMIGFLTKKNLGWFLVPMSLPAGLYLLEQLQVPVEPVSRAIGNYLVAGNLFFMLFLFAAVLLVLLVTRKILWSGLYADTMLPSGQWKLTSRIAGLNSFTQAGEIKRNIWLEINLLIRNKRSRQFLVLSPFYLGYLIYILADSKINSGYYLVILSMLTGFLPALYGQFLFSWESSFFDGIMTRRGNFNRYVKSKYYLLCMMALVSFIPIYILLTVISRFDPLLFLSLALFTIGVTFFIIMLMGTYNDGRIDLSQGNLFNYQGVRANQFVLTFLFILLPPGIFQLFKFLTNETIGILALAIPGLLFLVFHDWWIKKIIVPMFYRRKYKNLEGYRKLSV
jgi:hypothetical protein